MGGGEKGAGHSCDFLAEGGAEGVLKVRERSGRIQQLRNQESSRCARVCFGGAEEGKKVFWSVLR